jgi:hypothetical protein
MWALSRADKEQSEHVTNHTAFSEYVYREKTNAQKENQIPKAQALLHMTQFDKCESFTGAQSHLDSRFNMVLTWAGLWRYDELIKELLLIDEGAGEGDQEPVEIKSIDTSNLWRLAYLNVKVDPSWCEL